MNKNEKIEILGLGLFSELNEEMAIVEAVQSHLNQGIGWHYLLDLAWMVKETRSLPKGSLILDAGAGGGLSQFILSELGFNVISVDFTSRDFRRKSYNRYGSIIYYLNNQEMIFDNRYTRHLEKPYTIVLKKGVAGLRNVFNMFGGSPVAETDAEAVEMIKKNILSDPERGQDILKGVPEKNCGRIFLYKSDLKNMKLIPDNFVDAVVSISALEHNDHDDLKRCIQELLRVTKPGGALNITVSASNGVDYFHEPSLGWCYSEVSIKNLFSLPADVKSNFSQKEELYVQLKQEGNELHKRLSPFYFKSGDNGMPWGKWDPNYQPVGVVKIKRG